MEIAERYRTDAYRAVYTTEFTDVIFVLRAFQKKSKSGITTPRSEIELIRQRFNDAKRIWQEVEK